MAVSKSASRKSAGKKAAKARKSRTAAKKAAKTRKPRAGGKKAAAPRKGRIVARKAAATRKTKATVDHPVMARRDRPQTPPAVAELDNQIAIVRDNLRGLVEQAASSSGAANEELLSERITQQEAKLALLRKQREDMARR
jgi:hypothetical protein